MNTRPVLLSIAASLCAAACFAQVATKPTAGAATPQTTLPPGARAIDPAARSNMLARSGGIIQSPASGPSILFLNTQKRIPAVALQETSDKIQKFLRLPCAFNSKSGKEPMNDAAKALTDDKTAAVIVICDSATLPALLVAPEKRWALVNVAALDGTCTASDKTTERVQKELWRAFGYIMGAANSNFEHCLLKPVFSPADLDELKIHSLCPEPFGKMMVQAQKMGIKPTRMTTYRKAVEEGWAPAPTNDFQRAIWQELKK